MHRTLRPLLPAVLLLAVVVGTSACAADVADTGSTPEPAPQTEAVAASEGGTAGGGTAGGGTEGGGVEEGGTAEGGTTEGGASAALDLPATGVLDVVEVEGGCTVLDVDGRTYLLTAAPGADLAIDPANGVVATAAGEVIAERGDRITVDGTVDAGIITFCQVGPVLAATSVEPA